MKLIISNVSGVPIYEQIKQQIKAAILSGELQAEETLPSLRTLAKDLKRQFHCGNLAFFVAFFFEIIRLYTGKQIPIHSSITRESKWRYIMKKINLRELYPDVYTTDFLVDVTEEVMETIRAAERAEAAYERKMYRYKAQYSLARMALKMRCCQPKTPEMLEEKQLQEQVYSAVMNLPENRQRGFMPDITWE